jgi:hypothetical protein
MRRSSFLLGALIALSAISPTAILGHHCEAIANVTPELGPPGTTFRFETNLGATSDLYLFKDDVLVRSEYLDDSDFVSHPISTGPGDSGTWRARAEVRGRPECWAEAGFTVGTSSLLPGILAGAALVLVTLAIVGVGLLVALRRAAAR